MYDGAVVFDTRLNNKQLERDYSKAVNKIRELEEKLAALEEKQAFIDTEMAKPEVATNATRLQELAKEQNEISSKLESLYELWETLA